MYHQMKKMINYGQISQEIDKHLQAIITETNASRAALIQYHNGGRGINKQSFLKMSMTNEQIQLGVKPFINGFKDQFRSILRLCSSYIRFRIRMLYR